MHHYTRKTGKTQEKALQKANTQAAQSSGLPGYQHLDKSRQNMIRGVQEKRPLRRSEFIHLNGHEAWLAYLEKHNLPSDHKWADVDGQKLSSIGGE